MAVVPGRGYYSQGWQSDGSSMHEAKIPSTIIGKGIRGSARSAKPDCVIVLGNHASHAGIGDIVYAISDYFSQDYRVSTSEGIAPGKLNIIIDEFSNPYFVEFLRETRRIHPGTKYAVVATEFYTPIVFLGLRLGATFNFFGEMRDWTATGRIVASRILFGLYRLPYIHRRYLGFLAALATADAVLTIHPKILESLEVWAKLNGSSLPPSATVYPRVDLSYADRIRRLKKLPFGYTMTGTLTPYRKEIAKELLRAFRKAGYDWPIYLHLPFGDAGRFDLSGYPPEVPKYLYNVNPPQKRRWRYSSPMRILRAALLGQIPVITKKFGDHEIEEIAFVLDTSPKIGAAQKLWCEATIGREELVKNYVAAVEAYNEVAKRKNETMTQLCRTARLA